MDWIYYYKPSVTLDIYSELKILCNSLSAFPMEFRFFFVFLVPWIKALSHSIATPRRWHGNLKFLRAPWDRMKILENIGNNFTFSLTWRCHGAPTATVTFLRSAHGMPPRSHRVLTGDWLHGHGALMACSWRAKSCHCASTASTQCAWHAECVSTASSRSIYEHIRKSAPDILQNSSCIWTGVGWLYCLIFVDVDNK